MSGTTRKTAVIAGAGPAGLTAAFELLERSAVRPVIFEASDAIGGISRTVVHRGNRIDIGGHRFFSKSDRVMEWWTRRLPLQGAPARDDILLGRSLDLAGADPAHDPERVDRVMLVRNRVSRILFLRRFFDYPISLSWRTVRNLGAARMTRIGLSYARARVLPIRPERSLEDFFVNRFGRELYGTFFRDYTEKVWGVPCRQIRPEWGAQRIKGLSVSKALMAALRGLVRRDRSLDQKDVETSLINRFLYPKHGPGQMWEEVARLVRERGGGIHLNQQVTGLRLSGNRVSGVVVRDAEGAEREVACDYFISTMPVRDLVAAMGDAPPSEVRQVAAGLVYRDFITVGLLLRRLKLPNDSGIATVNDIVPDNWIYVQENDVRVGRLQIFNNWSPYLVADPDTVWIGLEYFCNEGDDLWTRDDEAMKALGVEELERIGVIDAADVLDGTVIRVPKTYPAYFGSYDRFDVIRRYTDGIGNLFLIGRNGMHRYNNMDHSMLAAMEAVEIIRTGRRSREALWAVNTEADYHEKK